MSDEEHKSTGISIGDIYDNLSTAPVPPRKEKPKKTEEFKEIEDTASENKIRVSCIEVSGDIEYKTALIFKLHPVAAGIKAFKNESQIFTDVPILAEAIAARVSEENLKHDRLKAAAVFKNTVPASSKIHAVPPIICVSEHPKAAEFAQKYNISMAAAGFMIYRDALRNSIVIIGKDDSALLSVCRLAERGSRPYLILGFPAGIGTQNDAKKYLADSDLETPLITMPQTKGGIEAAAACFVELMKIYEDSFL
ncbi:MAG: precorrin-8X methylmutase [Methanimicrococcus sp.]|nr:precorrin-8X methylmutase [Methanimicrococcus sp.]